MVTAFAQRDLNSVSFLASILICGFPEMHPNAKSVPISNPELLPVPGFSFEFHDWGIQVKKKILLDYFSTIFHRLFTVNCHCAKILKNSSEQSYASEESFAVVKALGVIDTKKKCLFSSFLNKTQCHDLAQITGYK